jgi:L-fuconolactonase
MTEIALEPELEIIDAHHHLWDCTPMVGNAGTYLFPEFLKDIGGGHRIAATVYVEVDSMYRADGPVAMRPVGEVEFVNGVAAMSASGRYGSTRVCAAIVGHADLLLGDRVREVLDAEIAAGGGRFRGIRHIAAADADPSLSFVQRPGGILRDPRFRAGFAQLAPLGLSFDSWQFHPQLTELVDLARAFPDTPIIVDHTGGMVRIGTYANQQDECFAIWKAAIAQLAACPNVMMKLGGLGMRFLGVPPTEAPVVRSQFLADAWRPLIEICINAFGVDRCMFESNFPVDRSSCSYTELWNAFKRVTSKYSASEKAALYRDSAARVYRLKAPFCGGA